MLIITFMIIVGITFFWISAFCKGNFHSWIELRRLTEEILNGKLHFLWSVLAVESTHFLTNITRRLQTRSVYISVKKYIRRQWWKFKRNSGLKQKAIISRCFLWTKYPACNFMAKGFHHGRFPVNSGKYTGGYIWKHYLLNRVKRLSSNGLVR